MTGRRRIVIGVQVPSRTTLRTTLVDIAIVVVLLPFMIAGSHFAGQGQVGTARPLDGLAVGLIVVAGLSLVLRRWWPEITLAITTLGFGTYLLLGFPFGPFALSVLLAVGTLAARRYVKRSALLAAAAATLCLLAAFLHPYGDVGSVAPQVLAIVVVIFYGASALAWALGTLVRIVAESGRRAEEQRASERAYQERLRTAQDVHDIVGHGLAAITMQAGVALHILDRDPQQARSVLEAIKASSGEALEELRATLNAFSDARAADTRRPMPGLDRIDALVARTRDAGLPVELVRTGQETGEQTRVPSSVGTAAYRIMQESLTNVLRHAGPAAVTIHLEQGPDELVVQVSDTGRGGPQDAVQGRGLSGMRARAAAVGGTLEAGRRTEGGFLVRATLPLRGTG